MLIKLILQTFILFPLLIDTEGSSDNKLSMEVHAPIIEVNGTIVTTQAKVKGGTPVVLKCSINEDVLPLPRLSLDFRNHTLETESETALIEKVTLTKEDNGEDITCEAYQDAENSRQKSTTISLNVLFVPTSDNPGGSLKEKDGRLIVTFMFEANPPPSAIQWRSSKSFGAIIKRDISIEPKRFFPKMTEKNGVYIATLLIKGKGEYRRKCYYLTVENEVGQNEFTHCPGRGGDEVGIYLIVFFAILIPLIIAGFIYRHKNLKRGKVDSNSSPRSLTRACCF